MSHQNMQELLCDYLEGTLDAARRKQVEALLQRHEKLRKALAQLQQARSMLRDLPMETMPAAAAEALQQTLRPPLQPSIPLYSTQWLIRLAAAVTLTVTAGLVIWATLPSPLDQRTVALDTAAPVTAPRPTEMATVSKDDGAAAGFAAADAAQPGLALKGGIGAGFGGGGERRLDETASANEPALMVVVADDIGGTQREIRDLLTLNNISYESVRPQPELRDELVRELEPSAMSKVAPAAAPAMPAPAAPAGPPGALAVAAPMARVEAARQPAAPAPMAQSRAAAEAKEKAAGGSSPEAEAVAMRAMKSMQQTIPMQRQAQNAKQAPPAEPYGVTVARNVTPDQLGRIRSGLRNASQARNLRVVDATANQATQRNEAADRDANLNRANNQQYPYEQQVAQAPAQNQVAGHLTDQRQQQVAETDAQRRVSFSVRYDVTIVVQGETGPAAIGAALAGPAPSLPATRLSGTLPSTLPAAR